MSYQYCSFNIIITRYICVFSLSAAIHWSTTIMLFLLCSILNYHISLIFSNVWICSFMTSKNTLFQPSNFRSSATYCDNWKTQHNWEQNYCGEGDHDSNINCLASVNLRQYTIVPIQCEKFPWTCLGHLFYIYCYSHFKKRLCMVLVCYVLEITNT